MLIHDYDHFLRGSGEEGRGVKVVLTYWGGGAGGYLMMGQGSRIWKKVIT